MSNEARILPWVKQSDETRKEIMVLTKRAIELLSILDVTYASLSSNIIDITTKKSRAPQIKSWPEPGLKSFEEMGRDIDAAIKRINIQLANKEVE